MRYKILCIDDIKLPYALQKLEKEVQKALRLGWELQGGVCIILNPNTNFFFVSQALMNKADIL